MRKERCWVWFRGGLNEASRWVGGFPGYRDARVPSWRVTTSEPADLNSPPAGLDESGPWQFF